MDSANGNTFKIESDSDTWMTFLDHKWVYLLGKFVGSFLSRAKFCEFRIIEIIAIENAYFLGFEDVYFCSRGNKSITVMTHES